MEKSDADALSPASEIEALEEEIKDFSNQRESVMQTIRDLRAAEDRETGKHSASEIFMLQQEKLRLDAEVDYREKMIRRIRYLNDLPHCETQGGRQ